MAKGSEEELKDIFPALKLYKAEHSKINLAKLCVEIAEFCQSVYASTQNEGERAIYRQMLARLR